MATAKTPLASPATYINSQTASLLEQHQQTYNTNGYPGQRTPSSNLGTSALNGYTTGSYDGAAYFPASHQPQPQQHFPPHQQQQLPDDYDQTHLNTLANSQRGASPLDQTHLAAPLLIRPLGKFTEEWDASQRGSSIIEGHASHNHPGNMSSIARSNSFSGSTTGGLGGDGNQSQLSRGNTLKKKSSLRRGASLKRSGSRKSTRAGSVRSLALRSDTDEDASHNAFYCPVPTTGNPTEALSNRFQAWRKILKDLITYFKEIQTHYEHRSKSLLKLANVLNNVQMPSGFLLSGGLDDAVQILRNYNSQAITEANKARDIEEDVILSLTGLRGDLQQKIKEIKNLSGDFKNTVNKEMDVTKRTVNALQDILGRSELDSALTTGKDDPYLLRLAVDRQLERQIDEENYLHQAYLNIEKSGRELESIVVGEIQKSYNAYAGILKRDSDAAYSAIDDLRAGPIAMPKDHEWASFVKKDDQFVDPDIPIRSAQYIHYPGRDHFACQEIRAGLLERKTKYLKSYTAGWYVLSATHLHEFKSADKNQSPIMSLYLPEQKLGNRSQVGGSSPKFVLKGRQTGGVHRGHSWVFRAESFDTMMAWYEDIKALTEKTPQERNDFVRGHSRSFSQLSQHSISSDGVVDEDDEEPYSAHTSAAALGQVPPQDVPRRPSPGGRFPSDLQVNAHRGLQAPPSRSSLSSEFGKKDDTDVIAAAGVLPGSSFQQHYSPEEKDTRTGHGSIALPPTEQAYARAAPVSIRTPENGMNSYNANQALYHQQYSAGYGGSSRALETSGSEPLNNGTEFHGGKKVNHEAAWLAGSPVEASVIPVSVPVAVPLGRDMMQSRANDISERQHLGRELPVHEVNGGRSPDNGSTAVNIGTLNQDPVSSGNNTTAKTINGHIGAIVPNSQTAGAKNVDRPAAGARTDSVPTISNLHIPGEYPKTSLN